ncbi:MAG: GNAT family N-acetyltransferase [Chitinispirillaceae bacterium]|nr:GNAT family N-acetyltransferase [Chitinispirillaceae bacterium]
MMQQSKDNGQSCWEAVYPSKFAPVHEIFKNIGRGNKLFISTGCGEPQYLVNALIRYVESDPKAFADAEIFQVWTLGVAVYTEEKFNYNFRHNSFFISKKSRDSVNAGLADYTPVFLSRVPDLLRRRQIRFDAALIQTSLPDKNGNVSLGISVDICKAAIENSGLIIVQMNADMPRVHGDTFINVKDIDYIIRHDEPLLEYAPSVPGDIARQTGRYVSKIVNDGDTIQIGYGSLPNAILENLKDKKHLGIHTELLTDGVVDLIKLGVIDNSRKTIDRGRTVASFCMGTKKTYHYIDDNPEMEFRTIEYTNDPLVISRIHNMTAINSALQIDLTGQASVESVEGRFYSGIGGSADFMRGALLAPDGKTILAIESTARNGEISRIVPSLPSGTGVTFNRGDIFYVVTEYGFAYLHGKNIRERAMDLIAIAHPKFREWLVKEAKKLNLIYTDQAFIPGVSSEYPEYLEEYRQVKNGKSLLFRPVRINDEGLVKEFFYSLSDQSLHKRFMSSRKDMPHKLRQNFVIIDYTKELVVLATNIIDKKEHIVGVGQFSIDESSLFAEVAFAVRDDYQGCGVGSELLAYLTVQAKKKGLHGFTADVLMENQPMLRLFEKMGFDIRKTLDDGVYSLVMKFEKQSA